MTTIRSAVPFLPSAPLDQIRPIERVFERGLAAAALIATAVQRFAVGPEVMPRHVVALFLFPAWVLAVRRFRGVRPLLVVGLSAAIAGLVLASVAGSDHEVSNKQAISFTLLLVGLVTGVCVVLWSRQILGDRLVGVFFAVGLLANGAAGAGAQGDSNPLKFRWAIPLTVGILAVLYGRRLSAQLVGLILLSAANAFSDARSMFGVCATSAILIAWQMRPIVTTRIKSWTWTAGMIGALGVGVYYLGSGLLINGYLGADAQARSISQITSAGSLLLGGRPEIAATAALFRLKPLGFGSGVSVNYAELAAAKAGMAAINYNPDNGYVERYMFGSNVIELHSTAGDLWAACGFLGIALTLLILWQVVRNASVQISRRQGSGIVLFLVTFTLWNLVFSPFYTSVPTTILALGLLYPLQAVTSPAGGRPLPNGGVKSTT